MEKVLAVVLERLLERYISLANMINSTNTSTRWEPETDVEVLDARKILAMYKRRNPND